MRPPIPPPIARRLDAWPVRYGFAFVAVAAAWASREGFLPGAAERSPFIAFGLAVLITSLVGGRGPGLLATGLSLVIALLFYLPPYIALAVHPPIDLALVVLFVLEGVVAAVAGGAVRTAARREAARADASRRFARLLERAEDLRGQRAGPRAPVVEALTARELEVVRLLALGLSNDQIAAALYVSLNTVKTHLKRVYSKLGVETRTEALARSLELGLLERATQADDELPQPADQPLG